MLKCPDAMSWTCTRMSRSGHLINKLSRCGIKMSQSRQLSPSRRPLCNYLPITYVLCNNVVTQSMLRILNPILISVHILLGHSPWWWWCYCWVSKVGSRCVSSSASNHQVVVVICGGSHGSCWPRSEGRSFVRVVGSTHAFSPFEITLLEHFDITILGVCK